MLIKKVKTPYDDSPLLEQALRERRQAMGGDDEEDESYWNEGDEYKSNTLGAPGYYGQNLPQAVPVIMAENVEAELPRQSEEKKTDYYCDVCNKSFTRRDSYNRHLSSKTHLKNVEKEFK